MRYAAVFLIAKRSLLHFDLTVTGLIQQFGAGGGGAACSSFTEIAIRCSLACSAVGKLLALS